VFFLSYVNRRPNDTALMLKPIEKGATMIVTVVKKKINRFAALF
jgi:hypothetical protein